MPAPVRTQRSRTIRRVPPVRRHIQRKVVRSVQRRRRSRSPSSSRSRSSSSSSNSSRSSRSHSLRHKHSQKRRISRNSRRRSNFVMPLYGTNGTIIVGYVRPCRTGVRLCPRND